jgi:hypothetical protein
MEHILTSYQCGTSDIWTYSGAWLNDLSALTAAIAAQQGQLSTEIPTN